jgi:hypothetical protein
MLGFEERIFIGLLIILKQLHGLLLLSFFHYTLNLLQETMLAAHNKSAFQLIFFQSRKFLRRDHSKCTSDELSLHLMLRFW